MRVAIYCRVSTLEQSREGHSIDEQRKRLKAFCEVQDWKIHDEYIDPGYSGGNTSRPGLDKLMKDLENIDLILVYKLDRLTRSVKDLMNLLEIFEQNNVSFRSATEVFDTTNAFGKLFITLVGAMAEWERTTIAERTKMGRQAATQKGIYTTTPPFYYDKVDGKLVPNEKREIAEYIIRRALDGISIRGITEELTFSKYKPPKGKVWDKTTVTYVLTSPATRGHTKIGEVLVENTHEPIMDEDTYRLIKEKTKARTRTKKRSHITIFRNKLVCHQCGGKLTMNTWKRKKKDGNYKHNASYYCERCKKNKEAMSYSIQKGIVEKAFISYLNKADFRENELDINSKSEHIDIIDGDKIMKQREKYQQIFSLGLITLDELTKRMEETQKAYKLYEEQLEELKKRKNSEVKIDELVELRDTIIESWKFLSETDKESLVRSSIKNIYYSFIEGSGYGKNRVPNEIVIKHIDFF
ncbi:recombinase family protein [Mammaliicoccus sciuri]|uniref:recombinase family protein n=1 Tax=Mammaliicoccus sciuri TaxID=1296 RepID=UPI003F56613E